MKSVPRLVFIAVAVYLIGDGLIFKGPLHRWLTGRRETIVAEVSGHPITRSQLARAVDERLWLDGKSAADLGPAELKAARDAALDELIDHTLLRLHVKTEPIAVSEDEVSDWLRRAESRFGGKDALRSAMKREGFGSGQDLRSRLAARIRQEKFVERSIAPSIAVSDEDAKKWFHENRNSIAVPERIEARHVFIPTLDHPPEEAKRKLDEALLSLNEKKNDFATLARELSEDPATKDHGGALGWMTRDRLPVDFAVPVFSLKLNKPTLVRTKLGWHLVEVTARKPAEPREFDAAKPEILAALGAVKRRQAVEDFRKSLRRSETAEIEIFPEAGVE